MIRELCFEDAQDIFEIVNKAACAYQGHIPDDCYHEPYMSEEEIRCDMKNMIFFGWQDKDKLLGVMGSPSGDVW
jgi:hypothetical protein